MLVFLKFGDLNFLNQSVAFVIYAELIWKQLFYESALDMTWDSERDARYKGLSDLTTEYEIEYEYACEIQLVWFR